MLRLGTLFYKKKIYLKYKKILFARCALGHFSLCLFYSLHFGTLFYKKKIYWHSIKIVELTREEYNIIKICPLKKLLNTLNRYDSKRKGEKLLKIGLGRVAKIQNISENEVNQVEKLQRKSIDELKEIASLRRIKNG